jgi:hypothetical protein
VTGAFLAVCIVHVVLPALRAGQCPIAICTEARVHIGELLPVVTLIETTYSVFVQVMYKGSGCGRALPI